MLISHLITERPTIMAQTSRITTPVSPSQDFLSPEVLEGHLAQLRHYADLKTAAVDPRLINDEPPLSYLSQEATHGSVTGLTLGKRNGRSMVGLSVKGGEPHFLFALDFIAIHLGIAFGMPMTLQKASAKFSYLRFRTAPSSQKLHSFEAGRAYGRNIYLLPVIANARFGQTVQHREPLADLSARSSERFDHHYIGRDALLVRAVEETWNAGKKARRPRVGRADFIDSALFYFDRNAAKAGLSIARDVYANALAMAFSLADWRYGLVGYASVANRNDPLGAAA